MTCNKSNFMNYIDIILIIPIIWFAYQGFKRGLVIELTSLLALILGIYAALYFSGYAANFLTNNLNIGPKYVPIISFIITFIVVVVIVFFIGKILEKLINMVALGFLNKLAGVVFGILKAAVFMSIIMLIINHFNDKFISDEKKEGSFLYEPIAGIAPLLWQSFKEFDLDDPSQTKPKDENEEVISL